MLGKLFGKKDTQPSQPTQSQSMSGVDGGQVLQGHERDGTAAQGQIQTQQQGIWMMGLGAFKAVAPSIGIIFSLSMNLSSWADVPSDDSMLSQEICINAYDRTLKKLGAGIEVSEQNKKIFLQCRAKFSLPQDPSAPLPKAKQCIDIAQAGLEGGVEKIVSLNLSEDQVQSFMRCKEVIESRVIPSESMLPTLKVNDRIFVDKTAYQIRRPKRSDLVVFKPTPALQAQNYSDAFLHRIIGLPGETIEIKAGKVYINKKVLEENYLKEAPMYQLDPVLVPTNQYFVLGDNRNNSYDSHYWGSVPRNLIIGQVVWRFYPPDRVGSLRSSQP